MLSLYEPQNGTVSPLVPARAGQLRTWTAGADGGLTGLRCYLLADLVRRVGEQHRLLVSSWHAGSGDEQALGAEWAALNIHPLTPLVTPPDPPDLGIGAGPAGTAGRWLTAAPVRLAGAEAAGSSWADACGERGLDPLALRLALLQRPYRQAAELGWDDVAAAGQLLQLWREQVADWANSPSKPMCAQYLADIKTAFDSDLDTVAALQQVAALAGDEGIPPGSRFETFVYTDHLLGLDLARDIGR